jgi:AraC-like DNA-binding protein
LTERNPLVYARFGVEVSHDVQFHMHYAVEVGIVFRGVMERIYQDGDHVFRKGEVWLTGVWEPHSWRVRVPGTEIGVFHIQPESLATMSFPEMPDVRWLTPFMAPPAGRPRVPASARQRFEKLFAEAAQIPKGYAYMLRLRLVLIEILVSLLESWPAPDATAPDAGRFACLSRAIESVFGIRDFVTSKDMARQCGLSRNTFQVLFRQYMGMSFPEFGLRYRLSRTAQELVETHEPIKAIAQKWGFADVSHFYRQFEAFYRCTPRAFRQDPKPRPGAAPA